MTKVFKILSILSILLVLCSPSCEDEQQTINREEAILSESKNDIREEFEADYLNEASLFAYESAAKQKLLDFADYLPILADTALNMSFRVKAGDMIYSTFQSEHVTIQLTGDNEEQLRDFKVHNLIKDGLENKLSLPTFYFDSLCIQEPLHRIGNNTYTGIIRFSQNFTDTQQPEIIINSINRTLDYSVGKEDKIFGIDTLNVWSVRLGEIR